jgi:hypothetical protein
MYDGLGYFLLSIWAIPFFIGYFVGCVMCTEAARDRDRSQFGFFILAFFGTPLLSAILLIALGDSWYERRRKREEEEERYKKLLQALNNLQNPTQ